MIEAFIIILTIIKTPGPYRHLEEAETVFIHHGRIGDQSFR